ncbi:MAG: hypothetical protein ACYTFY_20405 [Planctomycetota bacterium]|jgi:hypothetical protein
MNKLISERNNTYDFFPEITSAFKKLSEENLIYIITSNSSSAVESFIEGTGFSCVEAVLGRSGSRQ